MPLPSARRMSMTTTSGRVRSASRTASPTDSASATTRMSSVAASMALMPLRTTSWSSTSITRSGGAHGPHHGCSALDRPAGRACIGGPGHPAPVSPSPGALRVSCPRPPMPRGPFAQVPEPLAGAGPAAAGSKPPPVVVDLEDHPRRRRGAARRQVAAAACRLTLDRASRASCTTSPGPAGQLGGGVGSISATARRRYAAGTPRPGRGGPGRAGGRPGCRGAGRRCNCAGPG